MRKGTTVEVSVHVDAPPEVVYAALSDISRMGEWSPETVRCEWLDGATGPAVGARFKGSNKRGIAKWTTKPTVIAVEPGRVFAFDVLPDTRWTYRCEPDGDGTKLSESFEMLRDMPRYIEFGERWLLRVKDRRADLERGMTETIGRIKTAVEAGTTAT
jgi:uncharacterized protein YndB with AHSA1/START domain